MRPGPVLSSACVLFALYLGLAGSVGWHEIVAGVVSVLAVLLVVLAVHRHERRLLLVRPPFLVLLRVPAALLSDTARVAAVLCRAVLRRPAGRVGALATVPFRPGPDASARDAGRRGFVTLAASLAPNGFVLAVPRTREHLLLHRLATQAGGGGDRDWPV